MSARKPNAFDPVRVAALMQRSIPSVGWRFLPWILSRWLLAALVFYAATILPDLPNLRPALDVHAPGFMRRILGAAGLGLYLVAFLAFVGWRSGKTEPAKAAARMERAYDWLATGPWVVRVALIGVCWASIPSLFAAGFVALKHPGQLTESPWRTGLAGFAFCLIWAIPGAFAIRWSLVRAWRRLLARDPERIARTH